MNIVLISYLLPCLFFSISLFTNIFDGSLTFYSLSTSSCFVLIHIFSNELKIKSIKHLIIAIFYLFMLDLSFSFAIGSNILSFLLASLFFYRIKHIYQDGIKIIHYIEYTMLFFTFENIINYIVNQKFNTLLFASQVFFSTCIFIIYRSRIKQKKIEQRSIFEYNDL